MRDFYNSIVVREGIAPQAARTDNTAIVSEIIDMQGFDALVWLIQLGTNTDVDVTFVVLIEESDDSGMSGQVAVDDDDLNGTEALINFDFADDDLARKIGYHGSKRYIRMTITPSNNDSGNIFLSATAILGSARHSPNAQLT